jgi:hypothetical protein
MINNSNRNMQKFRSRSFHVRGIYGDLNPTLNIAGGIYFSETDYKKTGRMAGKTWISSSPNKLGDTAPTWDGPGGLPVPMHHAGMHAAMGSRRTAADAPVTRNRRRCYA